MSTFKLCALIARVVAGQTFVWTLVVAETGWATAVTLSLVVLFCEATSLAWPERSGR